MKLHSRLSVYLLLSALLCLVTACGNSTSPEDETDFDRSAMLANYGSNIILPSFEQLQESITNLEAAAENFEADPSFESLNTLQSVLKDARMDWQDASPFQFGPAEAVALRASINIYPTDTSKIEANIESGEYTLGTGENISAAGFPTLGYLLHGIGDTEEEIVAMYTTDEEANNRMTYLLDNISFIKGLVDTVTNEWQASGGDYIGMFLSENNAGTDAGSSLSMLINSLTLHYERFLRDGKIGIPAGVRSAGVPRPTATEAYYGGYSAELAVGNLAQIEHIFTGGNGPGLDDNLSALGAGSLADEIQIELDEARSALDQLSDPLSQQIEENNDPVLTAFEELQDVIGLLKADMTSILGITITYQDNDGD